MGEGLYQTIEAGGERQPRHQLQQAGEGCVVAEGLANPKRQSWQEHKEEASDAGGKTPLIRIEGPYTEQKGEQKKGLGQGGVRTNHSLPDRCESQDDDCRRSYHEQRINGTAAVRARDEPPDEPQPSQPDEEPIEK